MSDKTVYNINIGIRYDHLERIDVAQVDQENNEKWFNQTLTKVNDSLVRLGILEGEFHWHKHDEEDEFFFVLEGKLIIEVEGDRQFVLNPQQGVTIPKGVMHRPIAKKKCIVLMVETDGIEPIGSK